MSINKKKKYRETYYGSGKLIKQAIEKYGKENFEKEILEECSSKEHLDLAEIYWISYYNSTDRNIGYNIAIGGSGGDTISNHPDKEVISQKISESNKGKLPWNTGTKGKIKWTEERKKKASKTNKGRKHKEDTKEKMSLARIRWHKNATDEQKEAIREKLRLSQTGKKMPPRSDDQKRKHSEWMKENNPMFWYTHTEESREKMRLANKGKPKSEEHRKKLSEANKGNKPPNSKQVEINGVIYESISDAAIKTGINMSTLRNRIKSKNYEGYRIHETAD